MQRSLFDRGGVRKYLTARERVAFAHAACRQQENIATFCLTLAFTGARISEVLNLTRDRVDLANGAIVFESLKRRRRGLFRAIPVSARLLELLERVHELDRTDREPGERLWKWGRTTAWKHVKTVMHEAKIGRAQAMPKAARHAFGVDAVQNSVALNIVQKWMGHARLETTAIYTDLLGDEERELARRSWSALERAIGTPRVR